MSKRTQLLEDLPRFQELDGLLELGIVFKRPQTPRGAQPSGGVGGPLSPAWGDEEAPPWEMDDCKADALLPLLPGFVTEAG